MSSFPPSHYLSAASTSPHHTTNSPKRKRGLPAISTIPPTPPRSSPAPDNDDDMRLSTTIPGVTVIRHEEEREAGASSPRTKVAYNFQGLRLEDAGSVAKFNLDGPAPNKKSAGAFGQVARKKVKIVRQKKRVEVPETPQTKHVGVGRRRDEEGKFGIFIGEERTVDPAIERAARGVTLSNSVDEMVFTSGSRGLGVGVSGGEGGLGSSYPSINRLAQSKSRKKRVGTPPPSGSFDEAEVEGEAMDEQGNGEQSLTWHDDEITGHNPTDPDDDGEGINGIGFRPTPAEAYARTQKRRQQMAEYRNREAREARKMRSERRRGSEMSKASKEEQETARRVRFMEAEAKTVVSTS
ncbi:hypothetical protein BKA65DRAFT_417543 [Rhexocercosporidium sp. MPI-PUGE-AT-0058]|nr:hypothetical protein BKA65DRAFT_417543 [Rhexocercosporidium sp. MPI-PUGE-AT-0058]